MVKKNYSQCRNVEWYLFVVFGDWHYRLIECMAQRKLIKYIWVTTCQVCDYDCCAKNMLNNVRCNYSSFSNFVRANWGVTTVLYCWRDNVSEHLIRADASR